MRHVPWLLAAALATAAPAAAPAAAADPVALVENVTGSAAAGVELMEYLSPGRVIRLGAGDELVVDYFHSCVRETIEGGTVTVGAERSSVSGGAVRRERVECDGGRLKITAHQAANSGVVVFRTAPASPAGGGMPAVERTLYGLSPLVDLKGGGLLVLERLDRRAERLELDLAASELLHGRFYDFAAHGISLAAGGIYRASARGRSVVFRISPAAQPGEAAIAGRLLQL